MANFPKARVNRFPPPPAPSETTNNLDQPEVAPYVGSIDGRTLRATGRTSQFTTRISEDLHNEIKVYAAQHRMKLNELIEKGFAALKQIER